MHRGANSSSSATASQAAVVPSNAVNAPRHATSSAPTAASTRAPPPPSVGGSSVSLPHGSTGAQQPPSKSVGGLAQSRALPTATPLSTSAGNVRSNQHGGGKLAVAAPQASQAPSSANSKQHQVAVVADSYDRPRTPEVLHAAAKAPKSPPPLSGVPNALLPSSSSRNGAPLSTIAPAPASHSSATMHAPPGAAPPPAQRTKRTVTIKDDSSSTTTTRTVRGQAHTSLARGGRVPMGVGKHTPSSATSSPPNTNPAEDGVMPLASRWCPPNYSDVPALHPSSSGSVGLTGAGLLVGRYLVVTGGLRASDNTALSTIACYDTKADRWLPNKQQYQPEPDAAAAAGGAPPASSSSSPFAIATLPEPLYGHCCVTHGQRSVWLVGGVSGSHLSRSIVRLTIDIHFSNGATCGATPQQSPQPFHRKDVSDFSSAPPMMAAAPSLAGGAGRQDSTPTIGSAANDSNDEAVYFSVASCRAYQMPFPVAFASCVKLQGALHPVALIIGGLSTVRDSDCADMCYDQPPASRPHNSGSSVGTATYQQQQHRDPSLHDDGCAGGAALRSTSSSSTSALQETRRLGMTNRVFALNLDDCSMFRVAQVGETPRPRMMAAAAPVLRRDVSGSYGSILLFGGVTSTQAQAVPPPTSTNNGVCAPAAAAAAAAGPGGSKRSAPTSPPQQQQPDDDPRSVFVASVRYDPRSRTFSLLWSRFQQRSAADPWPDATAGHALCAMPGFTLLLGGSKTEGDASAKGAQASLPRPALAMLYDAVSGVAWSEVAAPQAALFSGSVFHRAIVAEDSKDQQNCSTLYVIGGGAASDGDAAGRCSTASLDGDPTAATRLEQRGSNHKPLHRFITRLSIPHGQSVVPLPSDDAPDDFSMQIHIEVLKSNAATQGRLPPGLQGQQPALPATCIWDTTVDRSSLCIDTIVRLVAEKIASDTDLRMQLPRALIAVPSASPDSLRHVLEHNLLLYSRGSEGERVPLSNDSVLKRMVQRCGLSAMPMVACFIPPIKGYRLLSKLGEGSFGRVYSAMNDETGQFFAVKRVRYMPEQREALLREIRLLRSLDHPNIVKYLGVEVMEDKQVANIFLEYVKMEGCGDLTSLFKRLGGNPSMSIVRSHLRQVLAALTYLHSYHIVHQDIKGANVLVGVDVTKLADFGTARQLVPEEEDDTYTDDGKTTEGASDDEDDEDRRSSATVTPRKAVAAVKGKQLLNNRRETREGTAVFMAPEVLIGGENDEMTTASDIWSVGCLLLEMTTGKLPWVSQLAPGDRRDALMELRAKLVAQEKPAYPTRPDFPLSGVRFLDDCLIYNPKNRKTAAQLLTHPFLTDELDDALGGLEGQRYPSPISTTQAGQFPLALIGRQPSDVLVGDGAQQHDASTLENCVESFVDAVAVAQQRPVDVVVPPPIRRAAGVPMALRSNRR